MLHTARTTTQWPFFPSLIIVRTELDKNALTAFPPCLGELKQLTYLSVESNHIGELPASISAFDTTNIDTCRNLMRNPLSQMSWTNWKPSVFPTTSSPICLWGWTNSLTLSTSPSTTTSLQCSLLSFPRFSL